MITCGAVTGVITTVAQPEFGGGVDIPLLIYDEPSIVMVSTAFPEFGFIDIVTDSPRATDTEPGETCPPAPVTDADTVTSSGSGSGSGVIFLLQLPQIPDLLMLYLPARSRMLPCNPLHQM